MSAKICKYTITLYVPDVLSERDREYLEDHIKVFLAANDGGGEVNVHPQYEEVDVTEGLRHLLLPKQEHCTGCGCELEDPVPTTYAGRVMFDEYPDGAVVVPPGSHLCDYCEDHFVRDKT